MSKDTYGKDRSKIISHWYVDRLVENSRIKLDEYVAKKEHFINLFFLCIFVPWLWIAFNKMFLCLLTIIAFSLEYWWCLVTKLQLACTFFNLQTNNILYDHGRKFLFHKLFWRFNIPWHRVYVYINIRFNFAVVNVHANT